MGIYTVTSYSIKGCQKASLEDCIHFVRSREVLGIDIETTPNALGRKGDKKSPYKGGLCPFLSDIIMLQIGDIHDVYVIDVREYTKESLQPLLSVLDNNESLLLVGQNLKFEGRFLLYHYGIRLAKVYDTMIVNTVLTNGLFEDCSLLGMVTKYLKVEKFQAQSSIQPIPAPTVHPIFNSVYKGNIPDELLTIEKGTVGEFSEIGGTPFTFKQVLYGAKDVIFPLLLREVFKRGRKVRKERYNPTFLINMENKVTQVLAWIENAGIKVDEAKWVALAEGNKKIQEQYREALDNFILEYLPQYCTRTLFGVEVDINWNSSTVNKILKDLGVDITSSISKSKESVGKTALLQVLPVDYKEEFLKHSFQIPTTKDVNRFIVNLLLYKEKEKSSNTFGLQWLRFIHPVTGRVHPSFRQIINTGRMSISSTGMQQIPAGKHRDCFCADGRMLNADFSAQEVRIVADLSQDETLTSFFVKGDAFFGDDVHSYSATNIGRIMYKDVTYVVPPKDIKGERNPAFTKEHNLARNKSKSVTFKLNYGGSEYTLQHDLNTDVEGAKEYLLNYYKVFQGLKNFHTKVKDDALALGYIQINSISDRRYFYKHYATMNRYLNAAQSNRGRKTKEEKEGYKMLAELQRKAMNYPCQGTAGDMMKLALCYIYEEVFKHNLDLRITNIVHDEVLGECSEQTAEANAIVITKCLEKGASKFSSVVPHTANTVISDGWEH